jgi:hypothetical protein
MPLVHSKKHIGKKEGTNKNKFKSFKKILKTIFTSKNKNVTSKAIPCIFIFKTFCAKDDFF